MKNTYVRLKRITLPTTHKKVQFKNVHILLATTQANHGVRRECFSVEKKKSSFHDTYKVNPACPELFDSSTPHATAALIKYGKRDTFAKSHMDVTAFFFVPHGSFKCCSK